MPNSLYEAARRRMGELRNAFSTQSMARNPILGQMDPRDMAQGLSATQPMPPAAANALFGLVPGIGDAIGLGQDVANYATNPGSRNWLNYGLSAAAMIPGVPRMPKHATPRLTIGEMPDTGNYAADATTYLTSVLPEKFKVYRSLWLADGQTPDLANPGGYWAETAEGAARSGFPPDGKRHRQVILEATGLRSDVDVKTSIARRRQYGEPEIVFRSTPSDARVHSR
jgi:hypothetical protein